MVGNTRTLTARMAGDAPAQERVHCLVALGLVGEISRGIPDLRVGVDFWVLVYISHSVCDEGARRDDFVAIASRDRLAADVSSERSAQCVEADRVAQTHFHERKLVFPGLSWYVV